MDMIFDTASDWLIAKGASCTNCYGTTYDIKPNLAAGIAKDISKRTLTRFYGSAELQGREYKDTVCIAFKICL